MELLLIFAIALVIGVIVGFVVGKQVSGWCVECGRSRSRVLREFSTGTR